MKKLIVLLGLMVTAAVCSATPVTIVFTTFHSQSPTDWQGGYPYSAIIGGTPGVAVMCDDWAHGGLPGQYWQANVTDLGTQSLTNLRFNQLPNALTLYNEAGWLLLQTVHTSRTSWTDINYAVWNIFDSNAPLPGNSAAWKSAASVAAVAGFPGTDFHGVAVLTPLNQYDTNVNGPQELVTIVLGPGTFQTTPEPGTLALVAGGLLGLWRRIIR